MLANSYRCFYVLLTCLIFQSCEKSNSLFTRLSPEKTNINFKNTILDNNERFSCLNFPYYYNGGGVAVGDFNNDGLQDIVFTGSMVKNRLYLNKGDFKFEDITPKSGLVNFEGWCTGVTVADVNQDGWPDIYICRSASEIAANRTNLLFINNRDLTFTESAAKYGLNDSGYSTQSSFFDYDKDGDLDMFLIKQSKPEYSKGANLNYYKLKNDPAEPAFENKLFRNDGGHFTDVTHQAGISSNPLTFSLGLITSDINMDGWPDIYVSNDYNEEDYVYINNKNGTFTQQLKNMLDHVALYSMGCDVSDYNNDLLPDICTLDMLPGKNYDLKMHASADRLDKYQQFLGNGFYPFFMRNQLQKNNGDGTFSEIAQLAGIDATDWSWSVLFADYDMDGMKDAFITNGVKRDVTNLDFMSFAHDHQQKMMQGGKPISFQEYISKIPGEVTSPYLFKNLGNDRFKNIAAESGLNEVVVSNGAAYADLDNDGDLDLITNNIDEFASICRNNSEKINPQNHFIQFNFKGQAGNQMGLGSKVFIYLKDKTIYQEQTITRGFQSGVDPRITTGLGNTAAIDSVTVIWPDDSYETIRNIKADQMIGLNYSNAKAKYNYTKPVTNSLFTKTASTISYGHVENHNNDFNKQRLMPHFYSHDGPCMAVGDVNGDKREDLFIGGSKGHAGKIFIQKAGGDYEALNDRLFKNDSNCKDSKAAFFDADADGDLDLYVVSGGYEAELNSPELQDRLYINEGSKGFNLKPDALPPYYKNKSCIAVCDINDDKYPDLFIGGSVEPGSYPLTTQSRILINDGKGKFTDQTPSVCPSLLNQPGIVHAAVWVDVNKDGRKDLITAGEWMPVKIYLNTGKTLEDASNKIGDPLPSGWWYSLTVADVDKDGDDDIIAGNYGLNSPLKASINEPMEIYFADLDRNGIIDPFISTYENGVSYPFAGMDDANLQVPVLRKKYYDYKVFASAAINDVFQGNTVNIPKMAAQELQTVYLENTGKGFKIHQLPIEAQYSPVFTSLVHDFNHDGYNDILLLGNNLYNKLRIGKLDANHGTVLMGNGGGGFTYLPQNQSGLSIRNDVRSAAFINNYTILGINDGSIKMYKSN